MGEMVTFPSNGGEAQGYLAVRESGQGPGVVVIEEWWGLNQQIKEVSNSHDINDDDFDDDDDISALLYRGNDSKSVSTS